MSPSGHQAPTAGVVPRWEWRTFGGAAAAGERFAAAPPSRTTDSEELYLVSAGGEDTVKVRGGLMDVKHLEEVDRHGLERWRPVMKAPFPLGADEVRSLWAALALPAPALRRKAYDLDQIVRELVEPTAGVEATRVGKRRRQYEVGACTVELADVRTERVSMRTLAVESEDPDAVVSILREIGLEGHPNVSYPRWLKALAGLGGPRYAAIDIGTNSVKLYVGEHERDGAWRTVLDHAEVTRLGEGLAESGRLEPAPFERTVDAVAAMAGEARRAGASEIATVGTAGLRMAANSEAFVEAVHARAGIRVEVVSGEEESRLSYLGVTSALPAADGTIVVFETGGGSSQFTFGQDGEVTERFSVDVGAARITERHGLDCAVGMDAVEQAIDDAASGFERLEGRPTPDAMVGIGGALTNLAAVSLRLATYDADAVRGTVLEVAEVDRQIELYRSRSAGDRRAIVGLQPGRAEVILAGACIVRAAMRALGRESLTVSDRGLRHGLLIERFGAEGSRA